MRKSWILVIALGVLILFLSVAIALAPSNEPAASQSTMDMSVVLVENATEGTHNNQPLRPPAEGKRFVDVIVQMWNNDTTPVEIDTQTNFNAVTNTGERLSTSDAWGEVGRDTGKIMPGNPRGVWMVFEVPEGQEIDMVTFVGSGQNAAAKV